MFAGDLISKAEAQQRTEDYEKDEIDSLHFLHLRYIFANFPGLPQVFCGYSSVLAVLCCACSPSCVIDATRKGNKACYMRHAADANCQSQKWVAADNQPRAFMVALREIAAGEELTFDSYRQCSLGAHVRSAWTQALQHTLVLA